MHDEGDRRDGAARPQGVTGSAAGDADAPAAQGALTARETQILDRLTSGASDPLIARELGISPRTASKHVENILAKLGVASRTAAAVAWVSRKFEAGEDGK